MLMAKLEGEDIIAERFLSKKLDFRCPECEQEVRLKVGKIKIPHFAHKVDSGCSHGVGETNWHLVAKLSMFEYAINIGAKAALEKKIGNRRADLLVKLGRKVFAYEFQRKPITKEIYKRTADLLRHVDHVVWVYPIDMVKADLGKSTYRVNATYDVNALYSDKFPIRNATCGFFDENHRVIIYGKKRKHQLYVEEFQDYGGYYKTSKRWCEIVATHEVQL